MRRFIFYPLAVLAYLLGQIAIFAFIVYLLLIGKSINGITKRLNKVLIALDSISKTNDCAKK